MAAVRVSLKRLLVSATALSWVAIVAAGPALAEDTCVADAPREASAVRGITWTGTVSALRKVSVDHEGVEDWTIDFAVDYVYAHARDRDFPKEAILAPGALFTLPNAACGGSRGDLGLAVGHRYLVSAAFITDRGSALGNLAIWEIEGERAAIVPGLYQVSFVSAKIRGVRTLAEALALLGVEQRRPTEESSPPVAASMRDGFEIPLQVVGALAAIVGLAAVGLLRTRRSGGKAQ